MCRRRACQSNIAANLGGKPIGAAGRTRRLFVVGGDVLHLNCLRCSRPNPAEAKFCSQCGAALLRKLCRRCHAINDADSHFCHWCGAALSTRSLVPAGSTPPPPADVPVLTDMVASDVAYAPVSPAAPPLPLRPGLRT